MLEKTELEWNKYRVYLEKAINKSKFNKRAEIKPMATPKGDGDSHLTSRANHERLAAQIIERISKKLGLNYDYAYIGMLMHDAGHPFSAHEGEEVFNLLGRTGNCGYYHHNAKGVEVILSEDICGKAINMIPGIENNPELRKKLEDEFYYFLDIVISHDGEATKKDFHKSETPYPTIKDAVETKLTLSNSQNNHKFIAQTNEGKLAKVADVLAYFPTDIQDGFRLGILKNFNEDYLKLIGDMFSNDDSLDDKGKIEFAKDLLDGIKERKVRELESDMDDPENKQVIKYAKQIIKEAKSQGLDISALTAEDQDKLDEIINKKIEELRKNTTFENDMDEQMFYSDMSKLREFTSKLKNVSTDVVSEITNRMEEYFIEDFMENSLKTGKMEFSKKAENMFYKIKDLNYDYIVLFTKWDYQRDGQPEAAKELVELVAANLVKSGVIRDKFYDRTIRRHVTNPQALKYMTTPRRTEKEYEDYKKEKRIIRGRKTLDERFTEKNPKKLHTYDLYKSTYEYARKHGRNFARKYMNVFESIPYTVRQNVEYAISDKRSNDDFLIEFQNDYNRDLRERMISEYGSIDEAVRRQEEFIAKLVEEERNKMEEKIARQLSIDYLSGMTDRSFNNLALRTGYMTEEQVYNAKRDGVPSQSVIRNRDALRADNEERD